MALSYPPPIQAVRDFQELIAGALAVIAAVVTARVVWRAARLPIDSQEKNDRELKARQLRFTYATLSAEWRALSIRARQADSTIVVVIAENFQINEGTKAKCYLDRPSLIADWTFMSLLSAEFFQSITKLYRLVDDHNFDIDRAGGAFGADNFRKALRDRLGAIQSQADQLAGQADQFLRELHATVATSKA